MELMANLSLTLLFLITAGVGLASLAAFLLLLRGVSRPRGPLPTALTAGQFSTERYAPLASLLSHDEYQYLRRQPGFTPAVGRRFRAERRAVCRQYLALLKDDFSAIYTELSRILLYSKQDRPELARALFEQRIRFAGGLIVAEVGLRLDVVRVDDLRFDFLVSPVAELQRLLESTILTSAATA